MKLRRATYCSDVLLEIFNNSYTFKKRLVLSTWGIFKPKSGKRYATLMSMNFNPKDLRANLFKGDRLMQRKL